ncbi:MAG: class I SAM-dependent methyltransferase [Betaproteobacteria bacterium]|nr:MAG: class I SAM-dependent methyltransferase [Betaproteobacteria bacterium]
MSPPTPDEVIEANIQVHTRMAESYNRNEPHYRPENRAKVRARLEEMRRRFGGARLLDLGCGTGFIIDLAKELFDTIDGVDITQAMLDRVDLSSGNVRLHRCVAEALPFADATFDVVSAYAFVHHLKDYSMALREALRVLKPGGGVYIDLEPNRLFWQAMVRLEQDAGASPYSEIVLREIDAVLHRDDGVQDEFGIDKEVFNRAEYTKAVLGGIDPWQFRDECLRLGFRSCDISFEWFLGQGAVMHQQSFEAAATVEAYLRRLLPLSADCFKYLQFVLTK